MSYHIPNLNFLSNIKNIKFLQQQNFINNKYKFIKNNLILKPSQVLMKITDFHLILNRYNGVFKNYDLKKK